MKTVKIHIKDFWAIVLAIICVITAVFAVIRFTKAINYRNNVTVHVWNAGKAATAEIAQEELEIAITQMETLGYTSGKALGFLEEENSIGFYYGNLIGFSEELKKFNENTNPEVYNVELCKLQERMNLNEAPYFISLGSSVAAKLYLLLYVLLSVTLLVYWAVDAEYSYREEYYEIKVPTFSKKERVSS